MRILIMVLSYDEPPFSDFMQVQRETWDAVEVPGIRTFYYHGKILNASDDYELMHWKFKKALDLMNFYNYDLIFRTNSCSYVVKEKLFDIAKDLSLENCYAGWDNGTYISGAGFWISRDIADRLRRGLTEERHGAEDVLIGQMLSDVPRLDHKLRWDCPHGFPKEIPDTYHYRFKTSNDVGDRWHDVENMKRLHQYLSNKNTV